MVPSLHPQRPVVQAHSRGRKRRVLTRLVVLLVCTTAVVGVGYYAFNSWGSAASSRDKPVTSLVTRGTLRIIVTERGNLESVKTVDGVCELSGFQNKIIQLTPEGSKVEEGEIVCRFDSAEIDKNIAQQEIKSKQASTRIETSQQELEIAKNKGESEIIAATVELELGELTLEKYQKGDYVAESAEIKGSIALKTKSLNEAKNELDQFQGLVRKGFKSPSDLRTKESNYAVSYTHLTLPTIA